MKRIFLVLSLLLLISTFSFSQANTNQPQLNQTYNFTTATSSPSIDIRGRGLGYFGLTYINAGITAPSACTVKIQSSPDNSTWSDQVSATCTSDGVNAFTNFTSSYVRITVSTLTRASNSTLIVNLIAFINDPANATGGTVTSITATSPLTGGIITSTGSIGITKSDATHDGYLSSSDFTKFNLGGGGNISGSGTTGQIPVFSGSTVIGGSDTFRFDASSFPDPVVILTNDGDLQSSMLQFAEPNFTGPNTNPFFGAHTAGSIGANDSGGTLTISGASEAAGDKSAIIITSSTGPDINAMSGAMTQPVILLDTQSFVGSGGIKGPFIALAGISNDYGPMQFNVWDIGSSDYSAGFPNSVAAVGINLDDNGTFTPFVIPPQPSAIMQIKNPTPIQGAIHDIPVLEIDGNPTQAANLFTAKLTGGSDLVTIAPNGVTVFTASASDSITVSPSVGGSFIQVSGDSSVNPDISIVDPDSSNKIDIYLDPTSGAVFGGPKLTINQAAVVLGSVPTTGAGAYFVCATTGKAIFLQATPCLP